MKSKACVLGMGIVAALAASSAAAYEAGDIIVRAGSVSVDPDGGSSGIALPALGIAPLAGTHTQVDSDTQLGLSLTYMLSDWLGVELLAATPFSHAIGANLMAVGLGAIQAGATKHLPPTLSLVWYPLDRGSVVSPYVGAGINYTVFFDESAHADLERAAGALAGLDGPVPMSLKLEDSVGLAAQVGVDLALSERWHLNVAVRWIDIETKATFKARDGSAIAAGTTIARIDDVDIDPWVYQVNIGYRF
ncbi:MAG: OmpW family outer membrane protein [Porticoccaceae bacterium]